MTLLTQEIQEFTVWEGTIGEMGPAVAPDIPVPEDFMNTVRGVDDDPLFVTVEVESGWSKSKRNWKPEHLKTVIDKVNKDRMAGNLGHPLLDEKEHERGFPIPQVAWVAAKGTQIGDVFRATFKGYVLKTAQARELLKLGLIDGVSIFGDSRMKPVTGGYEVISFSPETIDFARKGRSGMKSRVVALTGEQETAKGGNTVEPKDIAALSVDEIRTHAPLVYEKIQSDATDPLNTKIGEQETAIGVMKPDVDLVGEIRKLLKLEEGENPVEKITNLMQRIEDAGRDEIKAFINSLIDKRVKTDRGKALLRRFIGEMESDYEGPLTDELKTKITADFNEQIDGDDELKELVGEMAPATEGTKEKQEGGASLGGRSRAGSEHGRGNADGETKRGGLTIKTRKFSEVG